MLLDSPHRENKVIYRVVLWGIEMSEIVKAVKVNIRVRIEYTSTACELSVLDERGDVVVRVWGTSLPDAEAQLNQLGYELEKPAAAEYDGYDFEG